MTNPFVQSNFERVPGDYYPTIDSRCVWAFLEHFKPTGPCVDVCAPNGSGIVNDLLALGYSASCLPDAFQRDVSAQWIITNPPYKRGLVDRIINYQIGRVMSGDIEGLAILLRSSFDFAKSRECIFEKCPLYFGQIKMTFRPWWSEDRSKQPIHNYVWQIWKAGGARPVVMYSGGEKPS